MGSVVSDLFAYRLEVLDELARHGLAPRDRTPPGQLRDAVRDLYKYEIKRLRARLLAGQIERRNYANAVIDLRRRYPLLSLPIELWTVSAGTTGAGRP